MKKKIIAIALALCMVTSLLPATVLAASEGEPQCTVTEGCTLSNGHEGECVLPEEGGEPDAPAACTKTEGCTLAEGHEGVCVLPEEGGEPDAPAACTKTEGCTAGSRGPAGAGGGGRGCARTPVSYTHLVFARAFLRMSGALREATGRESGQVLQGGAE